MDVSHSKDYLMKTVGHLHGCDRISYWDPSPGKDHWSGIAISLSRPAPSDKTMETVLFKETDAIRMQVASIALKVFFSCNLVCLLVLLVWVRCGTGTYSRSWVEHVDQDKAKGDKKNYPENYSWIVLKWPGTIRLNGGMKKAHVPPMQIMMTRRMSCWW